MTATRTAALLLLIASTTGCSFVLVNGPPSADLKEAYAERGIVPSCTKSPVIPILDGLVGGVFVISGVAALANDSSGEVPLAAGAELTLALIGGVQVLSSVSGLRKVNRCHEFLAPVEAPDTLSHERFWNASRGLAIPAAVPGPALPTHRPRHSPHPLRP